MIRFKILGPVEVSLDGTPVTIGATKQRTLLALLLIEANRVVPTDRLVDELWGEHPPPTASGTLKSLVSRLRRLLTPAHETSPDSGVLRSKQAGYELVVEPDELDVTVFDRMVQQVHREVAGGSFDEAAVHADAGLALWRGVPLTGIPRTSRIFAEATRLEEARLTLLEQRAHIRLHFGEYGQIIAGHGGLLAEQPMRERLWLQLMLALYHSGRQADALTAYRDARESLISELGIEPGYELQQLHQQILNDNVPVPARSPAAPTLTRVMIRPSQLPPDTSDFTGRVEELAQVHALLEPDGSRSAIPIVAISGMAGVGKTTFALNAAHQLLENFSDGQLYIDLRGEESEPIDPSDALSHFLRSVGIAGEDIPASVQQRMAMFRSALAGRRMLVVLDNAAHEGQVEPLVPGSASCSVFITSRKRLSGPAGAYHIELGALDTGECLDLLNTVVGKGRVMSEKAAAAALVRLCRNHPLSLRICASRLAARPHLTIAALVAKLADSQLTLDELEYRTMNVRASFNMSYDGLEPLARELFCRLGLLRVADFPAWLAAPLLDIPVAQAEELVELLVEERLLQAMGPDRAGRQRYGFHDLIHCYSREIADREILAEQRKAIFERVVGAWQALADRGHEAAYGANFLLNHGTARRWQLGQRYSEGLLAEPWLWWEAERVCLVSVICQAAEEELDEACWDLAVTSTTLFGTYGYLDDWQLTHQAALDATHRRSNERGAAICMSHLGGLKIYQRHHDEAASLLATAIRHLTVLGDTRAQAFALIGLGIAERGRGDHETALRRLDEGRALLATDDEPLATAHILLHMGQTYLSTGAFRQAVQHLHDSAAIARGAGSDLMEGYATHWLGEAHLANSEYQTALAHFTRSTELITPTSDFRTLTLSLRGLARTYLARGDRRHAESHLLRAGAIAQNMQQGTRTGRILAAIGTLFIEQGNTREAVRFLTNSADTFQHTGAARLAAMSLYQLADLYRAMGEGGLAGSAVAMADHLQSDI